MIRKINSSLICVLSSCSPLSQFLLFGSLYLPPLSPTTTISPTPIPLNHRSQAVATTSAILFWLVLVFWLETHLTHNRCFVVLSWGRCKCNARWSSGEICGHGPCTRGLVVLFRLIRCFDNFPQKLYWRRQKTYALVLFSKGSIEEGAILSLSDEILDFVLGKFLAWAT